MINNYCDMGGGRKLLDLSFVVPCYNESLYL